MNLFPKKSLGQNFLIDKEIINLIIETGNVKKNDLVLEVGPGKGNLTEKILEKSPKELIVIEKDLRFTEHLNSRFGERIRIIHEDMMKYSFDSFSEKNIIVFGNLPYNISTQILVKWIKMKNLNNFCKKFILMFQKEVAERIIANVNTKNYGRLSILSNWKFNIEKIVDIYPSSFKPKPKVDSTLLVFTPKNEFYNLKNSKNLEYITNIFFSQKRKMIKKPLKFLFKNFEDISKKLSLDLKSRPQNLDNLTYYKICDIYETLIN
tara:strand:+ start:6505 stop:7296 length:792 start_codon:yes stop_codon:yes gene_type:complete